MGQQLVAVRNSSLHNSTRNLTFQGRGISGEVVNFPRSEFNKRLYRNGDTFVLRPNGYQLLRQARRA